MKTRLFITGLLTLVQYTIAYTQPAKADAIIGAVENGLTEKRDIVFADSIVPHYNIRDRMDFYGVPSVSIAVINNGKVAWSKAYGFADIQEKIAADTNTVYQAASISKSINSFCIMRLVEQGRLSLDKDVREYLKAWPLPENFFSAGHVVTLAQLLSHTAGLSVHGFKGYAINEPLPGIKAMLNGTAPANNEAVVPVAIPGTVQDYSGGGTLVTRQILADVISSNYDSLLQAMVLQPLGMRNSSFVQSPLIKEANAATGYDENKHAIEGKYYLYPELAPDGLWTTPRDYARFILNVQASLNSKRGALIKAATAQRMLTPVLPGKDAALGVFIQQRGKEKYFSHTGANVGFRSVYYGSFTTGNGIVIMVNSDNGQIMDEIANSAASVYHWPGFYNPEVRKLVALPDSLANQYKGTYLSENPAINVRVIQRGGDLLLTVHAGKDNFEKMYFTAGNRFFLMSSPATVASFQPSADGDLQLVVEQNGNILFKALKTE